MEVSLSPDMAARLQQWSAKTGREPDELGADAMEGYFEELQRTREMLDSRYETLRNGEAELIDGDEALRLLKQRNHAQRRSA
jgi:hypothetical protein